MEVATQVPWQSKINWIDTGILDAVYKLTLVNYVKNSFD